MHVSVIGWGQDESETESNGLEYWIAAATWGDAWGNRGFLKISRMAGDPPENVNPQHYLVFGGFVGLKWTCEPGHVVSEGGRCISKANVDYFDYWTRL